MREQINGRQFYIISACKGSDNIDDGCATQELRDYLLNMTRYRQFYFKDIEGRYKGANETSFYIDGLDSDVCMWLARRYGQSTVLVVRPDRSAVLSDPNMIAADQPLGQFVQVPEWKAKLEDSYSYDPTTDGYYICTNDPRFTEGA